jgi:hypothetical protein
MFDLIFQSTGPISKTSQLKSEIEWVSSVYCIRSVQSLWLFGASDLEFVSVLVLACSAFSNILEMGLSLYI